MTPSGVFFVASPPPPFTPLLLPLRDDALNNPLRGGAWVEKQKLSQLTLSFSKVWMTRCSCAKCLHTDEEICVHIALFTLTYKN